MNFKYLMIVEACEERSSVISARKTDDGVTFERKSIGWWLILQNEIGGHITFPLGTEPPDPLFKKGDNVTLTISRGH